MRLPRINRILDEQFVKYRPCPYPTLHWPTEYKRINQAFGINPQWYNPYGLPGHEGLDMRAPDGSLIFACEKGTVFRVADYGAYGKQIRIQHIIRGIEYKITYAHLKIMPVHKVGDEVKRGEVIGIADSTGNSTGSHLHITVKQFNGKLPDTYLQNKFSWPSNIIDPTMLFRELRYGYK